MTAPGGRDPSIWVPLANQAEPTLGNTDFRSSGRPSKVRAGRVLVQPTR